MAPNLSGVLLRDQAQMMQLADLVVHYCDLFLNDGGGVCLKCFHGSGDDALVQCLRGAFDKVCVRKPKASRSESREVYLLARGFHGILKP